MFKHVKEVIQSFRKRKIINTKIWYKDGVRYKLEMENLKDENIDRCFKKMDEAFKKMKEAFEELNV